MKPLELARKLNACTDATNFVSQFATVEEAWEACPRGDWMLWAATKIGIDKKILVGALSKCARTVQHLMKDHRSLAALDACDGYAAGKISEKELNAAATYAAAAAATYAAAAAAAYAADAAAHAADAAYDVAKAKNRAETATICQKTLTYEFFEKLKNMGGQ